MRDKSHMEQVERWAEFVRVSKRSEWKPGLNDFINAQFRKAENFYKRLRETEKGREILERLKEERVRKN